MTVEIEKRIANVLADPYADASAHWYRPLHGQELLRDKIEAVDDSIRITTNQYLKLHGSDTRDLRYRHGSIHGQLISEIDKELEDLHAIKYALMVAIGEIDDSGYIDGED